MGRNQKIKPDTNYRILIEYSENQKQDGSGWAGSVEEALKMFNSVTSKLIKKRRSQLFYKDQLIKTINQKIK